MLSMRAVGALVATVVSCAAAVAAPASDPSSGGGLVWTDVRSLGVRGRAFNESVLGTWTDRLPAAAQATVRQAVWSLSHDSAGMYVDFETNSTQLHAKVEYSFGWHDMPNFVNDGLSGLDLYQWDATAESAGAWRWTATFSSFAMSFEQQVGPTYDAAVARRFRLHLPLYNSVVSLSVGTDAAATVRGLPDPYATKAPVVWYGTSIAQGGKVSHPGIAFTNQVRRNLRREVFNYGFSGNCLMEVNVTQWLVGIPRTPGAFVVDCLWNMNAAMITERTIPLVKQLRGALPADVPIVLIEGVDAGAYWFSPVTRNAQDGRRSALRAAYKTLVGSMGVTGLHYIEGADLFKYCDPYDSATAGGVHPTDDGQVSMARIFTSFFQEHVFPPTPPSSPPSPSSSQHPHPPTLSSAAALPVLVSSPHHPSAAAAAQHAAVHEAAFAAQRPNAAADAAADAVPDLDWTDAATLRLWGQALAGGAGGYSRVPASMKGRISPDAYAAGRASAGLAVSFTSDATEVWVNLTLAADLTQTVATGSVIADYLDLYAFDATHKVYRFVGTGYPAAAPAAGKPTVFALQSYLPGTLQRYLLHLPTLNEVTRLSVGVNPSSSSAVAPDPSAFDGTRPVLWYGGDVVQGTAAARGGSALTSAVARRLGVEVLNYGIGDVAATGETEKATFATEVLHAACVERNASVVVLGGALCLGAASDPEAAQRRLAAFAVAVVRGPPSSSSSSAGGGAECRAKIVLADAVNTGDSWLAGAAAGQGDNAALRSVIPRAAADVRKAVPSAVVVPVLNTDNRFYGGVTKEWVDTPFVTDDLHPSDIGQRLLGDFFVKELQQLL
eukprot:Rhum_TRINITY_DN14806_c17_g1::Rhum_TRINITY_DN14806_c17_g1_i1::g.120194::m.120194